MKKLLTTLAMILGLLFGGLSLAPTAMAADGSCGADGQPACPVAPPCGIDGYPACPPAPVDCGQQDGHECDIDGLVSRVAVAEQTANDYRAQVASLQVQVAQQTARADRLQRVADRRAATIQRLRAKIRALR